MPNARRLLLTAIAAAACTPAPQRRVALGVSSTRDTATAFGRAVARGTRSWSGAPGPRYWQQTARYTLAARLDPGKVRLTGSGRIVYVNRSPDTLRDLAFQLAQNIHAYDAPRSEPMPVTGGITLTRVAAQGRELASARADSNADGASGLHAPSYRIDGTVAWVHLPQPLAPHDSTILEFAWWFRVPPKGGPRYGQDGVVWFLGYWYPQLCVYDDILGWNTDPYLGRGEFYMDYADYDVRLTVPDGWLVGATGELVNEADILTPEVRARLDSARHSERVVHVVSTGTRGAGRATLKSADGELTWHFVAQNVRDFAFGTSAAYLWDAVAGDVGDRDGDGASDTTLVSVLFRPYRPIWGADARYAKHSVEFLSRYLWPYPYSHITVAEGLVDGGMEYPMIVLVGGDLSPNLLYSVTVHEIGHEWFPMQVGSNERRFGWMDEGLTSFDEAQGVHDFLHRDDERRQQDEYLAYAGRGWERPMLLDPDEYPHQASYQIASYDKPTAVLRALRGVLGDSVFLAAYRTYGRRWTNRHPQPDDFWHTFEDISHRDLGWFWREWFAETWTLDQAIDAVRAEGDSLVVTIGNHGRAVMPVPLAIVRAGHVTDHLEIPVDVWLAGRTQDTLRLSDVPRIERIVIDPERWFPDQHRGNNTWTR